MPVTAIPFVEARAVLQLHTMPIFSGMPPELEDELALELPEDACPELLQDASTRAVSPSPPSKTANDFMISPLAQHGIAQ